MIVTNLRACGVAATALLSSFLAFASEVAAAPASPLAMSSAAVPQEHAPPKPSAEDAAPFPASQQRGIDYLVQQEKDGSIWGTRRDVRSPSVGLTALALAAVLSKPEAQRNEAERGFIAKTKTSLLAAQNEDGSFGDGLQVYQTSAAIHALAKLEGKDVGDALRRGRDYLLGAQNVEANGYSPGDTDYGSFGYGPKSRGDMSNTQFAIEALRVAAVDGQNDAFTKALAFLQRSQNLRSVNDFKGKTTDRETKATFEVVPGDDGGCGYYPGNSAAGYDEVAEGVRSPRSYGSMTYALLKTYLLCGLPADDERVQAAVGWIRRNWSVEHNPGASPAMGEAGKYQGLFYYYETMSRALAVAGIAVLETTDEDEAKHDWRRELRAHLEKIQRPDGSWLNERNPRWWEDQPALCTIFALLALDQCGPQSLADSAARGGSKTEAAGPSRGK